MGKKYKIMIIAGEASGDLHGASLANELKLLIPGVELIGMGGSYMQQAGVKLLADISHISVCGFVEIIRYLPKIYSLFKLIKQQIVEQHPDLLILIDYPTFNLKLAKIAKKLQTKVLYYISPQIWAWHTSRIKKMQQNIAMMGVIFPFEVDFYRKHAVPVKYVGHPLVGKVMAAKTREDIKALHGIREDTKVIGLLPGSRKNEIQYILPTLIATAELLNSERPSIQFVLPLAETVKKADLQSLLSQSKVAIKVISEERYSVMSMCDAVVAASGTVTLELSLLCIPMVIVYKANYLSFAIAKRLVKIPYVGLCNIIAGKKIAEELLQEHATPEKIKAELLKIIEDDQYREQHKRELTKVTQKLSTERECSIGQLAYAVLDSN